MPETARWVTLKKATDRPVTRWITVRGRKVPLRQKASKPHSLRRRLGVLRNEIAAAAQEVYDKWEQDEEGFDPEYGTGGICDDVMAWMWGAVEDALGEDVVIVDGAQPSEDHAWLVVTDGNEAWIIDIPASVYESGSYYTWSKKPGVKIKASDIIIERAPDECLEYWNTGPDPW